MINKISLKDIVLSAFISVLSVIFLWGFWTKGVYALGFNFTIIYLIFMSLFLSKVSKINNFFLKNYYWIIGMFFIILSFSLYENPFLKVINIFLIPILFLFFVGVSITDFKVKNNWNFEFILGVISRRLPFQDLREKFSNFIKNKVDENKVNKIVLGFVIFLALDTFIILLLSGADKNFSNLLDNAFKSIDIIILLKVFFAILIFLVLVLLNLNWEKEYVIDKEEEKKNLDTIISGIVLTGVLLTYFLFISVQFSTLISGELPKTTDEIAMFVKNGFWQLFFVSMINIFLIFIYYKRTIKSIQIVLFTFVVASIIILLSASNKMFMYISNFGFSYEKFFASYVVLFFGILFFIILFYLFSNKKVDILKITIILGFLMYSFINIIPSERIMFETNLLISKNQNNQMQKYQSHIFSIDILPSVQKLKGTQEYEDTYWNEWTQKRVEKFKEKKWYEKNINYFYINE